MIRAGLTAAAAALLAVGAAHAQGFPSEPGPFGPQRIAAEDAPLAKITPVTDAMLADPPASEWLMWRRTYDGWGYSPLDQINRGNVQGLRTAWAWSLPTGTMEGGPLEHDGVLFVQSYGDGVDALNAVNGDLLWTFRRPLAKGVTPYFKRMMAISGEKLLLATSDKHLIALDVHTGKPVWDVAVAGDGTYTSGPMALRGKAIIGASNCVTSRCSITAHDLETGKELWRFYTVAAPGEPGGDTWNGLSVDWRFGGSSWTSGAYDPKLNLLYWGVGQPYPWNAYVRGTSPLKAGEKNSALYTDNTLALDPDSGKLVWNFDHLANDSWDMDYVFERVLLDLPVGGSTRKVAVTSGKMAILEGLDAQSGKFLFAKDLGIQNIVKSIDPVTGAKTINPAVIAKPDQTITICPHPGGGRSVPATAYDPQTGLLYVPLQEHCSDMTSSPRDPGEKTAPSHFTLKLKPGSDGQVGRLDAVDLKTRQVAWSHRARAPQSTAALPTAGGLVFEGDLDRWFKAYDARTGEELWRVRLNDIPNAAPITYAVNGRQYVAVTTGSGSPYTRTWTGLVPDVRYANPGSAQVWVFELPER